MAHGLGLRARLGVLLEVLLARHWWRERPSLFSRLLQPLSWIYEALARRQRRAAPVPAPLPVPVLVVGNLIVGGAGKTPTVMALVRAFQAAGRRPGVISRGHGRQALDVHEVQPDDSAQDAGDEPLLIRRRSQVPVWVGRDRPAAARALCAQHPEVDVLISDDGLQHSALHRDAELLVFDQRGVGNGLLLPAGPLREALPRLLSEHQQLLYTGGVVSTPLAGVMARRALSRAWPLPSWQAGDDTGAVPLAALQGRRLLAVAGLAAPQKFFSMLQAAGLDIHTLPLPDHHDYSTLPWPADTPEVLLTEKDAVKLPAQAVQATAGARIWVLPLDFELPPTLVDALLKRLPARAAAPAADSTANLSANAS